MPSLNIKDTYIVYKTTNKVNGKFYIGVHKVSDEGDTYLGSGLLIRKAIDKYGKENFERETLAIFDNYKDAYDMEFTLVTHELVSLDYCYNLKPGGEGGRGLVHTSATKDKISKTTTGVKKSRAFCEKMSKIHKGKKVSDETRQKQSNTRIGKFVGEKHPMYGKKHSLETRIKISNSRKGKPAKNTNVQFFTLLANRVTYTKSTLSKWYPEFREYY